MTSRSVALLAVSSLLLAGTNHASETEQAGGTSHPVAARPLAVQVHPHETVVSGVHETQPAHSSTTASTNPTGTPHDAAAPATHAADQREPAPSIIPTPQPEAPAAVMETHLGEIGGSVNGASAHAATTEEILSLLRIGASKRDQNDFASAEIAFMQVLAEKATPEQDREALLGLARTYRKKGDFTKASAIYERFIKGFPADPDLPAVYLELGRTMRALGAHKQAIARFYSVLNSTLKLPVEGEDQYRQLARTAQFEIAETYFQLGDFSQATRFFSRLKLLDLAPEDRARAHFKSVYALTLASEDDKAILGLRSFLEQYPEDENVPEARYLLSIALRRVGRSQESLLATLELLKVEATRTRQDAKRWAYWQRRTGNQLANEFYQSGDIPSALLVYQSLAALSNEPSWNLPVTYQIGLCLERLRRYDRARDCYQTIVDNVKSSAANTSVRPELSDLAEMAAWRLSQISWQTSTESQLSAIFTSGSPSTESSTTPAAAPAPADASPAPASAPASASAHDHHGSAPIASTSVR